MRIPMFLLLGLCSLPFPLGAAAKKSASAPKSNTECLGPTSNPKGFVIYLHGLAPPNRKDNEIGENREVLERLAKDLSLRIAIPRAAVCPKNQLCWPARDKNQVLATFKSFRERAQVCFKGKPKYSVIGFSNGGYFAFKLYKAHQDPLLTRIISSGGAGNWDDKKDKANPYSTLAFMMGNQDVTLKETTKLFEQVRKAVPGVNLEKFTGGHRIDYATLVNLIKKGRKS